MPITRLRAVRTARSAAASVLGRTPHTVGPAAWRDLVTRARISRAHRAMRKGQADKAQALFEPLLDTEDVPPRVEAAWAKLLFIGGDRGPALDHIRLAAHEDPASIAIALTHLQLSARGSEEFCIVLARLITMLPRRWMDAAVVVSALQHSGDLEMAERYQQLLEQHDLPWRRDRLRQVIAGMRLGQMHGRDPEAFQAELDRLAEDDSHPLRTAVEGLTRVHAWEDLATVVRSWDPSRTNEPFPSDEVGWAARRALRAGRTSIALELGHQVLTYDPGRVPTQELVVDAQDQLDLVAHGWQPPAIEPTRYEPAERTVLSVLWQSMPIRSGGYATRTHGVLTSLAARGWDIQAVTRLGFPYDRWPVGDRRTVPPFDDVDGIRYHRLLEDGVRVYPPYPLADYVQRCADGIVERAVAHRARLVHAASFFATGLAGASAARRLGLPFVYEMRGLEDLMKVSWDPSFTTTDRYQFLEMMENECCREADAVLVITEALCREMIRRGVDEKKLHVLPNGVHADRFAPRERDLSLEAELGVQGVPVIGYAGSMVDYEGLELLLEAAAELKVENVSFHLVMVGDGPAERSVRAKASQLQLGDVVTFVGRVPHEEVARFISLFDIAPFPRLPLPVCELISPMKPFESLAMGKAVVVSSVAALTEIVQDGVTGLVFDKGDRGHLAATLRRLIESAELRATLGEAGREWVRRERDWSSISAVADRAFSDVLGRHAERAAADR